MIYTLNKRHYRHNAFDSKSIKSFSTCFSVLFVFKTFQCILIPPIHNIPNFAFAHLVASFPSEFHRKTGLWIRWVYIPMCVRLIRAGCLYEQRSNMWLFFISFSFSLVCGLIEKASQTKKKITYIFRRPKLRWVFCMFDRTHQVFDYTYMGPILNSTGCGL